MGDGPAAPFTWSWRTRASNAIATLREGPLHAALKAWYRQGGDETEVPVDGRQIDLVRSDLLIEIQTSGLAAIRKKLERLVSDHPVRLVHPVPLATWIVRVEGDDGALLGRRRSPRKGRLEDAFGELVSLRGLLAHPNLSLELLLTHEEEVRGREPGRAWRRKGWVILERRLIDVVDRRLVCGPADLRRLLPRSLPAPFTTADLAEELGLGRDLARKMAYCLRETGAIVAVGKEGNALRYRRTARARPGRGPARPASGTWADRLHRERRLLGSPRTIQRARVR